MNAVGFAWRSLVRQPARASLGVLGIAAVGALLLDMLLLSNGLVTSMRQLFDRAGFDMRVTASDARPGQGPRLPDAEASVAGIAALPGVRSAFALRLARAQLAGRGPDAHAVDVAFQGVAGRGTFPWTVLRGRDLSGARDLVVNEHTAAELGVGPGDGVTLRASCDADQAPPAVPFTVTGVADFPFDNASGDTVAASLSAMDEACGGLDAGTADVIIVASTEDAVRANVAADVARRLPRLTVMTNDELVGRLDRGGFAYFRQISAVLTTVTLSFAALLITVLLTVSVNQRLGEIAALRALGFTRGRVAADVLCESAFFVGGGGLLSVPLGLALAAGLDAILKGIPGVPVDVHFFTFQPRALWVDAGLLAATALVAALYPVQLVTRLPIASTLRNEVIG